MPACSRPTRLLCSVCPIPCSLQVFELDVPPEAAKETTGEFLMEQATLLCILVPFTPLRLTPSIHTCRRSRSATRRRSGAAPSSRAAPTTA